MIKADVVIAEQRQIIDVPVMTKSEAIRVIFNTYGISTEIKRWIEDTDEVENEQINSKESTDSDEPAGEGGNQKGDILQANE